MRVIKHGNKVRTITCIECECKFEFLPHEVKKEFEEIPFLDKFCYEWTVNCPECNKRLVIRRNING